MDIWSYMMGLDSLRNGGPDLYRAEKSFHIEPPLWKSVNQNRPFVQEGNEPFLPAALGQGDQLSAKGG